MKLGRHTRKAAKERYHYIVRHYLLSHPTVRNHPCFPIAQHLYKGDELIDQLDEFRFQQIVGHRLTDPNRHLYYNRSWFKPKGKPLPKKKAPPPPTRYPYDDPPRYRELPCYGCCDHQKPRPCTSQ
jgi:hypothetical protein